MRKPLIAGNWKMFMDVCGAKKLVKELVDCAVDYSKVDVMLAPPFVHLYMAAELVKESGKAIQIAAQNVHFETEGAFTGEISSAMVKSVGAQAVILGHSERRHIFGETDAFINKKVHAVLKEGLTAIVCVGEQLAEREAGVASEVVIAQLGNSLSGLTDLNGVVIAYEPVWAIGTGKTASPEDAQNMHADIRAFVVRRFGKDAADKVRILYGGSVKPDNIKELMACPDVDGALVGGASLKADSFSKIIAM
jgi:triosephosphate isomerase